MEGSSQPETGGASIPDFHELLLKGALDSYLAGGIEVIKYKNITAKLDELELYYRGAIIGPKHEPYRGAWVAVVKGPDGNPVFLMEERDFYESD